MKRLTAKVRTRGAMAEVRESWLDAVVRSIDPIAGKNRLKARMQSALAVDFANRYGARTGATQSRKWAKEWFTEVGDANADSLEDLEIIRARSQDLIHNHGLACGAAKTKTAYCVGTGLKLNARVDADALGLSDEDAAELNRTIEKEWQIFCRHSDIRDKQHFQDLQATLFKSRFTRGDAFVLRRFKQINGSPYGLRLQLIEADRVANPDGEPDSPTLSAGVRCDQDGTPTSFVILNAHPGSDTDFDMDHVEVPVRGPSGLRNVIHYHRVDRIGETRGVPELAPVIELLKQLSTLTSAELMASVVSAMFTVFVKTPEGEGPLLPMAEAGGAAAAAPQTEDYEMGNGAIVDLANGEDVEFANPTRPNASLDAFIVSMLRQIAPAIEMPVEVLINHFTSSYTAARAAFEQLWKTVRVERQILEFQVCREIYQWFFWEGVASERIPAPGFFSDAAVREAYLASEWIGPAKGTIDEVKDATAAKAWIDMEVKPHSTVVQEVTGEDPDTVARKIASERAARGNVPREIAPSEG